MKIFVRERRKAVKGEKLPRFRYVGVMGGDLKINAKRFRKVEIEDLAKHVGAEVVYLARDGQGVKGETKAA